MEKTWIISIDFLVAKLLQVLPLIYMYDCNNRLTHVMVGLESDIYRVIPPKSVSHDNYTKASNYKSRALIN